MLGKAANHCKASNITSLTSPGQHHTGPPSRSAAEYSVTKTFNCQVLISAHLKCNQGEEIK
eukprot:4206829-Ditylum_brightwellii.AAC.1